MTMTTMATAMRQKMATKTTTLKPFNNGAADEDDGVDDNDCDNNEAHRGEHLQMNLHNEKNEKESIINVQLSFCSYAFFIP